METNEQTELTNKEDGVASSFRLFLMGIAGLAVIMAIFVLLPMLFTFLSSGDTRAPSQLHAADPVGKSDHTIYKPLKK